MHCNQENSYMPITLENIPPIQNRNKDESQKKEESQFICGETESDEKDLGTEPTVQPDVIMYRYQKNSKKITTIRKSTKIPN